MSALPVARVQAVMRRRGCDFYAACAELGRRGGRQRAANARRGQREAAERARFEMVRASRPDLYE